MTRIRREGAFWFDKEAADRAEAFFPRYLQHVKGRWAGEPFELERWQREQIIRPLFGWKREDGSRRYRSLYVEVPRKNGKSTLGAGIALLLLCADGEPGAEVYSAAADRDQARIIFDVGREMVEANPELARRTEVYKLSIVYPATSSTWQVLSAEAYTKHGKNAHGIVFDELHAQPNRELWDVLTTSTGARRQPVIVGLTTAGFDRESICWEIHEYARQVLEGIIRDDSFLPVLYAAPEDADWTKVRTWRKANPNLGVTIAQEFLAGECARARQTPPFQNTFRRLYLNQWTHQEERWLDLAAWDRCAAAVDTAALEGRDCYAGLDLSATTDVTALALVFPPSEEELGENERAPYRVLPSFWLPADDLRGRCLRDKVNYDIWAREGLLQLTAGSVVDYAAVFHQIQELGEKHHIREVAFDRWGAAQISQELDAAGYTVVPFGQGFASMSAPTKELLNLVLAKRLAHGGNPVLRWMADCMVVKQDAAGNVKPSKPDRRKSGARIDGIVALIMALDRTLRNEGAAGSVYEERGPIVV